MAGDIVVVVNNIMSDITVNEAARRLDRSIEQVRRYLRERRLPGRGSGGQWFIDEEALAAWRPQRRALARVGEPAATYEARMMKAKANKKGETLNLQQWLQEVDEIAENIRKEAGELKLDVVELLRRSRQEH